MKASAARKYRRQAKEAVEAEGLSSIPWGKVEVHPFFFHKTARKRDADNAIASLKAAYDGIVDAGLVPDDDPAHMVRMPPEFSIDKIYPRVVLTLVRADGE